jgi:hypothetical protein
MGIGNSKNPIVSQLSENVYCGVRLGMGNGNRKFNRNRISRLSIMATKITPKKPIKTGKIKK